MRKYSIYWHLAGYIRNIEYRLWRTCVVIANENNYLDGLPFIVNNHYTVDQWGRTYYVAEHSYDLVQEVRKDSHQWP